MANSSLLLLSADLPREFLHSSRSYFQVFYNLTPKQECQDTGFKWSKEQCSLSEEEQCNELKNCSHVYIKKPVFRSMVNDFDLLCDKSYDATWVIKIFFLTLLDLGFYHPIFGSSFRYRNLRSFGRSLWTKACFPCRNYNRNELWSS